MAKAKTKLSLEEEIMILQFWAHGIDIRRSFSAELMRAIPELQKAIEAISCLPDAIGWGDEHRGSARRPSPDSQEKSADWC